jgi:hypothetical protein
MKEHDPFICPGCSSELAQRTAKKLADNMLLDMQQTLTALDVDKLDDDGMFQGQVCHLLSAFILCHSIKILKMRKIPDRLIEQICANAVEMAYDFARDGKFREVKEH